MRRRPRGIGAALALGAMLCVDSVPAGDRALTLETVARDWDKWAGMAPDRIRWQPDGKGLYFEWNPERGLLPALHVVSASGGEPRKVPEALLASVPQPPPGRGSGAASVSVWNRDGTRVVWERDGDVFLHDVATGRTTRLTNTEAVEQQPAFSHDETKVTFQSGANLFVYSLADGSLAQLTRFRAGREAAAAAPSDYENYLAKRQLELFESLRHLDAVAQQQQALRRAETGARPRPTSLEPSQEVQDLSLTPDARKVTFVLSDSSRVDRASVAYEIPKLLTASGQLEIQKGATGRASDPFRDYRLGILDVADGSVKYVDTKPFGKPVSWNAPVWSRDGSRAVAWAGSQDHKDVWLCLIDVETATARPIFHDQDDAWVRGFRSGRFQRGDGQVTEFLPDGRSVYFLSERDGWFHLYVVDTAADGALRQLTSGPFEVTRPTISRDGSRFYFLSSEGDLLQRHLYTMPIGGGARTRLTPGEGWYDDYQLSPDGSQVAFLYGNPDAPDELFVMEPSAGAAPRQLTRSTTDEFRSYRWQRPQFVSFPDPHGWTVHAGLVKPERPGATRPAIIFVHGTGWTQGVDKDFAPYLEINRAQFQFYAEHGYTVLAVDYKGSRGYGRESRVSLYKKAGEPEVESLVAAVDYLVKHHGVDRRRIGIYGHSWGGYVVNMALFTRPGTFAAGVAEAGIADHGQQGTSSLMTRILGTPMQDAAAYERASPLHYARDFQDRLLILHGAQDVNVPLQQAYMLVQRLQELGKTGYDIAVYPLEGHIPHLESSRLDMERRRFAFFESVLKGVRR